MSQDEDDRYPTGPIDHDELGEAVALYDVPPRRMESAMILAGELLPEELSLLGELSSTPLGERRRMFAEGMRRTLRQMRETQAEDDPLRSLDDPMDDSEAAGAVLWADVDARRRRRRILSACVDAQTAGDRTGRSRQSIERLRRDGRILALRVGRQWRYPAWQFDADGPGGVVPGLDEAVESLMLSPMGAADWLTTPHEALEGQTPIERLRRRDTERVVRLATRHGYLP